MEEDSDDRYSRMNEKITTVEKRMTILEDPNNRGSEMKANDMEGTKAQEEQNQRRAVVTGFHDDTTEQEVQDRLKETITTAGMSTDRSRMQKKDFIKKDSDTSNAAFIQRHNVPLEQIKMNRWTRHVSSTER